MSACARCGAPHAPFGLGKPLVADQQWFCGVCIQFQPASQAALAQRARAAIEDAEISVR